MPALHPFGSGRINDVTRPAQCLHAGKRAYDLGDWTTAVTHFREALRLREALAGTELVESTRLALDAADACATASAVAVELHRLVPGGHDALRPEAAPLVALAQPHVGLLVNSRNLLLAGPAPQPAVHAIHRYYPGQLDDRTPWRRT